jgi:tyramine---L-glutamate ligase
LRLFICEYVTGGGLLGSSLPPGLAREGDMMLGALVKDVAALDGIDIVMTRDARLGAVNLPAQCHVMSGAETPWAAWRSIIETVDAVWPIAPETGGALARLSDLALTAGRCLIGSRPEAVEIAGSKFATAERLAACGIATVATIRAETARRGALPAGYDRWVLKPDDGAGAEATRLFCRREDLTRALHAAPSPAGMVVQPYVAGAAASLSVLCRDGRAWLLSCNHQDIAIEGGAFRYRGGVVGGLEARRPDYAAIAGAVAIAIPGLWGYIGIDVVDGPAGPVVLEVNPRLTTSYVALGRAVGLNPAGLILRLLHADLDAIKTELPVTPQRVDVALVDA